MTIWEESQSVWNKNAVVYLGMPLALGLFSLFLFREAFFNPENRDFLVFLLILFFLLVAGPISMFVYNRHRERESNKLMIDSKSVSLISRKDASIVRKLLLSQVYSFVIDIRAGGLLVTVSKSEDSLVQGTLCQTIVKTQPGSNTETFFFVKFDMIVAAASIRSIHTMKMFYALEKKFFGCRIRNWRSLKTFLDNLNQFEEQDSIPQGYFRYVSKQVVSDEQSK